MQGWVKFHRDMLQNPIVCKDAEHFAIWSYLLLKATHKEMDVTFAGQRVTLKPGQLITGRKQIADHFKIAESKVQRVLKKFEEEHQIMQQSSNKNRLISIVNWGARQEIEQPEAIQGMPLPPLQEEMPEQQITLEETLPEGEAVPKVAALNHQEIIAAWNSLGLSQIKKLAGQRLTSTKARVREHGIEEFIKAIYFISESSFLQGQNDRGWTVTYDWFIKPSNFLKVSEGNYTDKAIPKLNTSASGLSAKVQMQNKMTEHGNLLDDVEELERRRLDLLIEEMNKAKAQ